jgi:hypothetical protein
MERRWSANRDAADRSVAAMSIGAACGGALLTPWRNVWTNRSCRSMNTSRLVLKRRNKVRLVGSG